VLGSRLGLGEVAEELTEVVCAGALGILDQAVEQAREQVRGQQADVLCE
jgi:histone H3/H4